MAEPKLTHVLESGQFTREFLEDFFPRVKEMECIAKRRDGNSLASKTIYNLFYQRSVRTRTTFSKAIRLLGGSYDGTEQAGAFSSEISGGSMEDTIRILGDLSYDAIILRQDEEKDAAKRAAAVSSVPIISAGDKGQHPTQALVDIYTIFEQLGRIDGVRIALVGDLKGRATNSLTDLASRFNNISFYFVSPKLLRLPDEIKGRLDENTFTEGTNLKNVLPDVDVVYMTRAHSTKLEHARRFDNNNGIYNMDQEALDLLPPKSIVMHPLPRGSELPPELDNDHRVVAFRQAQNGLYVRMAVLDKILGNPC